VSDRPLVIVFARVPQLGRVKTRLARGIGHLAALRFYRATLGAIVQRLSADPRWETRIAATPDRLARSGWRLRRGVAVDLQGHGDLGRRMLRAILRAGRRRVAIVGCDVPALDAAAVDEALRVLAHRDVVFGPSPDGGYWLIGWRGTKPSLRLFDDVRWSASTTRDACVERLRGKRLGYARILDDVDEVEDLQRVTPSPSGAR